MWGIRTLFFLSRRRTSMHMDIAGRSLGLRSARARSSRMERMWSLCAFSHNLRLRFGFLSEVAGLLHRPALAPAPLLRRRRRCVDLIGNLLPLRRAVLNVRFGLAATL